MSIKTLILYNPSFEKGGVENNIKNLILLFKNNKKYDLKILSAEKNIDVFGRKYKVSFQIFYYIFAIIEFQNTFYVL